MRWLTGRFGAVAPRLLKYQVLTKLLTAAIIVPLYAIVLAVLLATEGAVTNSNIGEFLDSWRGWAVIAVTVIVVAIGFAVELSGYISLTARARMYQPEASYWRLIRYGLSRLKNVLGIGGLALIAYLLIVVPLSGIGVNISYIKNLKIPKFVTSVIWSNPLFATAYAIVLALLAFLSILLVYTIHLIVLCDMSAGKAMLRSARMVRKSPRIFIVDVAVKVILAFLIVALIAAGWWYGIYQLLQHVGASTLGARILFAALLALQNVVTALILFIQVPYYVNLVTHAFYHALRRDEQLAEYAGTYPDLPAKTRTNWVDRAFRHPWWMLVALLVGIAVWSGVVGANFERIYRPDRQLEIVAHRAGGETMPENSISGLLWAVDVGADWVEIDVQRTKDGAYVLNHDDTFLRVAGEKRKVSELTLAEINELNIGNDKIAVERVPQLEEFLQVAKDQMKVIIELKGATADEQMADDVVELVTKLDMVDQVMVMGLDYDLIKYIEATNPQITTGYCYFISLGDITQLAGDYMVLEEGEASNWRLLSLSYQGKGAMVWTVNTEKSMRQMVTRDISAIITDRPERLQEVIAEDRDASDVELFFRIFLDIGI